jgi:hypothetical protein
LPGITTADFENNSAGFMAAIDALGPNNTGEIAGTGSIVSTPEPSTWAMARPEQIARNPKSYIGQYLKPVPGAEGEGRATGGGVKRHSAWRTRTFRIYNRSFAGGLT